MDASLDPIHMPERAVAIIGGGPAGLVAARFLKKHGFDPVVFEAAAAVGGQWNVASSASAVWPSMRTNTSRVLTAFSDLDHPLGTNVYPSQADMLGYLQRYAETAGLAPNLRLSTPVEGLDRGPSKGWIIRSRRGERSASELFSRVVVATGCCTAPDIPAIAGLSGFAGRGGASHSSQYGGPELYRGQSVLVAGCSISALEIASELAASGVVKVSVAMRRQRYVLQKLLAGVPTDHVAFTRFAAQAGRVLPPEAIAAAMKQMVLENCGSPEQFGAPRPDDNIFAAGLTQSQNYLALVAEGRIQPQPWIKAIDGQTVHFADGSSEAFDAIILGTGFGLTLPFVSETIAANLGLDGYHIDLHDHTLHPDLDGLGFIGLYPLVGPYFPVLELQARWLAYVWAGLRPMPSIETMQEGVSTARARRSGPRDVPMHALAILFAAHAGVEPRPEAWPALERALWFGPLSPASFRLTGPDAEPNAATRAMAAARSFNAIIEDVLTPEEIARVKAVTAPARAA
jgi:dimethylaniline monooxygenase (N-oxide forming)